MRKDCSNCKKACSPEEREECANQILFDARFLPDVYPVSLSAKTARQRRFEEEKETVPLTHPDARVVRSMFVLPDLFWEREAREL